MASAFVRWGDQFLRNGHRSFTVICAFNQTLFLCFLRPLLILKSTIVFHLVILVRRLIQAEETLLYTTLRCFGKRLRKHVRLAELLTTQSIVFCRPIRLPKHVSPGDPYGDEICEFKRRCKAVIISNFHR